MTKLEKVINRDRNQTLKSISSITKEIYADRGNASLYNRRGNKKCLICDYIGAIEDYTKSIELDPKYAELENINTAVNELKRHLRRFKINLN